MRSQQVVVALVAGLTFVMLGVEPSGAAGSLQRIAGPNRLGTAIEISQQLFPTADSAGAVIVARQDSFPDALAASSLAGIMRAPVLLNAPTGGLDPVVRAEIDRVLPPGKPIFLIGGTQAVSAQVHQELLSDYAVERLAGANRYETAMSIKARGDQERGYEVAAALFARGDSYPDALSVSSYAAYSGTPIILVERDKVPGVVEGALISTLASPYVIGGTAAISDAVVAQIESSTGSPVTRISGADRYATSAAIAEHFFVQPVAVMVATGQNFPDALAGGVLGGLTSLSATGVPLLLVQQTVVPSAIEAFVTTHNDTIDNATSGYVLGGEAAVSLDTEFALEAFL